MKFQYISDLHFEFGKFMNIEKYADNLMITGDIGDGNIKNILKKYFFK